ncbi:MAG TPA: sugar phosphate isomerase/epimerase family protein [Bacteroidales bacterium]|nr:sugar phosphate isomerase/epimerase family protein [Bacteroidales bacterium]HOK75622.1 sugar phosphate isomerase/epimerase family protein [Bacteroidales bacterium]HOM41022.1 sugar phosphate isomerase/epimerase family protein [Bacteroidales bacterium]HPP93624.1 sugar phosphate isomerase/epimerase family protein [Bacteroidales bacterium]HQK72122.1 sugar phosphate isomerase/epimerase family protein [Bacteroidales bacterium]
MNSRRNFIRLAGTGLIAAGMTPINFSQQTQKKQVTKAAKTPDLFGLGMAGYTFAQVPLEKAIEIMKRVNVTNLSLKDVYLPLNSNQETITSVINKFKEAGITVYTVGVIYMKSEQAVDQAFEYTKMVGVKMMVGAPNYELLPYVEKKVKEYDIKVAIHNHGPDNPLFPNATDIWNHIKDLDPRIGICLDIGHTVRDGEDPSLDAERYAKRLFDVHIKDVTDASKAGRTVEMGRGVIDIHKFITTLRKIKYSGMCSLEFEKDMKDPLAGIAESIGYWRGVLSV